jgi:hypothetical protein
MRKIPLAIKIVIYQLLFLLLHYLYDWFPNNLTTIFSGINESVYQHMKIGFFAYLLFAIIEFLIIRKAINSFDQHVFSRLFSATYLPLIMLVFYLVGPLTFGHTDNMLLEIVFANLALIATSLTTFTVESHIEKAKPNLWFKIIIIVLFVLSLVEFIAFTNELPWFDIFAIPPGW